MADADGEAGGPVKVTLQQLGVATGYVGAEYEGHLDFDIGNLSAYDPAPLDMARLTVDPDGMCAEIARGITQALVTQLFNLPAEAVRGGRLANLPAPTTQLPRALPVPKAKPLTKWQQFAAKKGIVKRKRSKLAYDDTTGEWRRRYGYKRLNDDNDIPIIEAKATDKPGEDPFAALAAEKRERVKANRASQLANLKQVAKRVGAGALPASLRLAATLPGEGGKKVGKGMDKSLRRKELKQDIKSASRLAGISTASIGKFDKRLAGEKPGERAPLGKRRQFMSVTDVKSERSKIGSLADKFLKERSDDIVDIRKAMGKFEADAREERRQAKRKREEDGGSGGGGGGGGKRAKKAAGGGGGGGGGGKGGRGFKGVARENSSRVRG
ncbi:hypothetical protein VOLCADRAFT_118049 [Volvox carteri f. nagariensis]|uniref:Ribosome biogenesis regulatory protein n=1 Tax=Volvox carteri f. nagariensis TaxID=3068 RepID=D8U0E6_VOLCA|nr:uncharacterized protein VOLCADRAFT_118049 [Volvox carteri f. nagariensis]EFJ46846.1 hypothetical protein VOLCADRAFT_118049 [Volvox carteri f. nagariensis]|eukprot:XP_002952055.1 hypothetical protein VOLCADRAFT_118049 [Volvox carteri f. nagariensis]